MDGSVSMMFQAGVDDYWRGSVPEKWNDAEHRASCAYCMGWYLESLADNGILPEPEDCDA
jgi:hypothetical protein